MTRNESIIELGRWLQTPPGRYLLGWEQACLDEAVADAFGYHALQLGLAQLQGLRTNRMPHRWVGVDTLHVDAPLDFPVADPSLSCLPPEQPVALHCDFDALPFPNDSLDLVVLPHALELARDPHLTLAEVERVLVPEGRVLIVGLNPASLWGWRQAMGRSRERVGIGRQRDLFLPRSSELLGYRRVRDWLRLLSFEVEGARFGCWRPPLATEPWLERFAWMEPLGGRWWPVLGAVYFISAVKRVRGMRLVGLSRRTAPRPQPAPAVVANRHRHRLTHLDQDPPS
ncbi:MAG: class I SAM-dependent methyltransferase [Rubrivivax sp.]